MARITMPRLSHAGRDESGQGLVEMLIAMFILAVAIAGLFTLMTAGALSLQRASQKGTAAALADKQLELYRVVGYDKIRLASAALTTALTDSIYITSSNASAGEVTDSTALATCTPLCAPIQTNVVGPDKHRYRIDTYINTLTPPTVSGVTGRTVKQVVVIVRNNATTVAASKILAQNASTFDQSTAATTGN
jgi:Tfp pilus assembly protein PilV